MTLRMQHLLVLAAMNEEETALVAELGSDFTSESVSRSLGMTLKQWKTGQGTVCVARSGMGNVNSALTLAMIADRRPVDAVLLLGVGGALIPSLDVGDLVVSSRVLQHDYFASLDFGHPRMRAGEIVYSPEQAAAHVATMEADEQLVRRVLNAVPGSRRGTVLSGSEFVGTVERKRAIAALHEEALLVEMEAAGVAQVSGRLGLPFAVAKTVADRLQPDGTIESDFRATLEAACKNAALALRAVVQGMGST
jgi:5'-methylthioadenosine/S-adenosylhomocysteine nucleosidase